MCVFCTTQKGYFDIAQAYLEAKPRWPGTMTVIKVFGTWNAGIVAAGFEPRKSCWPSTANKGLTLASERLDTRQRVC